MSVSAVSAVDLDDNNDTVALSDDAEILAAANDVDAMGDLNEDDVKSVATDEDNEIYGAGYDEAEVDSNSILGATEYFVFIDPTIPEKYDPDWETNVTVYAVTLAPSQFITEGSFKVYLNNEFKGTFVLDGKNITTSFGVLDADRYVMRAEYYEPSSAQQAAFTEVTYGISKNDDVKIEMDDSPVNMYVGDSGNMGAELSPSNAGDLTYSSNDTGVVTVDENGDVAAVGIGNATITVSFEGNTNYAAAESKTVAVTVKEARIPTTMNINRQTFPERFWWYESIIGGQIFDNEEYAVGIGSVYVYLNGEFNQTIPVGRYGSFEADFGILDAGDYDVAIRYHDDTDKYGDCEWNENFKIEKSNTTIRIAESSILVYLGDTANIDAELSPTERAGNLTYSSNDTEVAAIDENGEVTGIGAGTATITVSFAGNKNYNAAVTQTVDVTVKNKTSTKLDMRMDAPAVYDPSYMAYIGGNVLVNGTEEKVKKGSVDIYINDIYNQTIEVGESEISTPLGVLDAGSYVIKAYYHDTTGEFIDCEWNKSFEISQADTEITVNNTSIELHVSQSENVEAELLPFEAGNLIYSSNDAEVATVSGDGTVEAIRKGTALITVSFAGNKNYKAADSQTVTVTVEDKIATELDLSIDAPDEYMPDEFSHIVVQVLEVRTEEIIQKGSADIYLNGSYIETVEVNDEYVVGHFGILDAGSYVAKVSYFDNSGEFADCELTVGFEIGQAESEINVKTPSIELRVTQTGDIEAGIFNYGAVIEGNLTYSSNDTEVAAVDENGTVTAVCGGTAAITVSFAGNKNYKAAESKTVTVTVENQTVTYLTIGEEYPEYYDPYKESWVDGSVTDMEAHQEIKKGLLKVYLNNELIETVKLNETEGFVNVSFGILDVGNYQILAQYHDDTDEYADAEWIEDFTINQANTIINIPESSIELNVGDTGSIGAQLLPFEAGNLSYSSNDTEVVLVENDNIWANKEGTAVITVSFDGNENYAAAESQTVTVTVKKIHTEITLEKETFDLKVYDEVSAGANLTPADAGNLTYTSSNENVVVVRNGNIKALAEGNAIITVSFAGDDQYAAAESKTIAVTVSLTQTRWYYYVTPDVRLNIDGGAITLPYGTYHFAAEDYSGQALPEGQVVTIQFNDDYTINATIGDSGKFDVDLWDINTGTYTVTFSSYGYTSATATATITKIGTEITAEDIELLVGDRTVIDYNLIPSDAKGDVVFISNDTTIAYANPDTGSVVARAEGTATVTVVFYGDEHYAPSRTTVTVSVSKKPTEIDVSVNYPQEYDPFRNFLVSGQVMYKGTEEGVRKGSVDIYLNDEFKLTVDVDDEGSFRCDLGPLDADTYELWAKYHDDTGELAESESIENYTINQVNTEINVMNPSIELTVGEGANIGAVIIPSEAGNLSYSSDDINVVSVDENGDVTAVGEGTATVTVSFEGNKNYAAADKTVSVTVTKFATILTSEDVVTVYKNATGELVAAITDADGNPLSVDLNVELNGETYNLKSDANGQISVPIANLSRGTYVATISYAGNDTFAASSATANVVVNQADSEITGLNTTVTYNYANNVTIATITSVYGSGLAVKVNIKLNGEEFAVKSNPKGQIRISTAGLDYGTYTAEITYRGYGNYKPASATAQITVAKLDTVITPQDVSVNFTNPARQVIATLTDVNGKALSVYVNVTFNGATYDVKSNSKGQVTIKTNALTPGTYDATIEYAGDEIYSPASAKAQITVDKADSVITAPGISVPYKNTTNHTIATITSPYGKALAVYVNVTVNGEKFVVRANYKGEVSVSTAKLAPGTYDATISYRGNGNYNPSTVTTQITVEKAETVISASDISVAYKDVDGQLVATLINAYGKPLAVYVHVNFNGKDYDVLADSNGQIIIPTKTLSPGEYTATITYNGNGNYNPTTTTAQVTVNKADSVLTAQDVTVETGDPDGKLVATLTNAYGKALASYVHVSLNGEEYDIRADSNGQVIIPTNDLASGIYEATITYRGNGNYNPTSTIAQITVKD